MTYVSPEQIIFLGNETSFEHTISQLQPNCDKILCVQDGYKLLVFNSGKDLPANIRLQLKKFNKVAKTYEYHYRCNDSDSAYALFHPAVFEWIEQGRKDNFHIQLSKPSIIEQVSKVSSIETSDYEVLPANEDNIIDSDDELTGKRFDVSMSGAPVEELLYFPSSSGAK